MSLHTVAKHMAAKGRGPDTQLVHMSNREVAGLQALAKAHGGSLTINPETGMVEAGFLDRMLPAILGAGLAMTGVGAPMAGLLVGGLQTARTGDLGKGLMAGFGAYGGYGLADGMAASAAPTEVVQAPVSAPAAPTDMTAYAPTPTQYGAFGEAPGSVAQVQPTEFGAFGEAPSVSATAPVTDAAQQEASRAYGVAQLPPQTPPTAGTSGIGTLSTPDAVRYGGATLASMADTGPKAVPGVEKYTGPLSRYSMSENYRPYDAQQPNPYYRAQYQTYAGGGAVEQMSNANAIGQNTGYPQADISAHAYATPWQTPVSENMVTGAADTGVNRMTGQMAFAGGGIAQLGSYSDGGQMLKGPGDGMSDSIPAKIGAKQPARLADGEFVVPADVVSHLGNGSSDAGAKQLYKMMDRIRQQRTGKKKQAPQVNPSKAMPA